LLAAFVLIGLVIAPLASIAMFIPVPTVLAVRGWWAMSRRLVSAVVATAILAAIAFAASVALGTTTAHALAAALSFALLSLLLLPATRRWNGRAHACWAACTYLYLAYLVFIFDWTLLSGLGLAGTIGGLALWALELIAGIFGGAYLWELCDALGTEDWRRRVVDPVPVAAAPDYLPFVSLHVPAHNEPPDMVIETLQTLLQLDYPSYEIVALDDNTDDETLWRPVEEWCHDHGVKFVHLSDWPGYKSGALNYALTNMTDPRAELIGVVDSDYQIDSGFLRACAPLFADPSVGFIQAPQDYRDWQQAPYYRRLYYSYKYFFAISQPSRNEHDAAIFAGTMGLIRRAPLQQLGGWNEWCITEDAELSLRLMRAGWSGLHVDRSFGHGVMPLTFEALKSQRYRWCFGGIQILRMNFRLLLPGRRSQANRLSQSQRWGYLAGGLQWYGDLLGVIFYLFLLAGAVNLALGGGQLFRKLTVFLVAAVPVLVLLGLIRAVALLRRGTGAAWGEAFGAFFIWQATSIVVARASVQGLFAKQAAFLRTPKTFDEVGAWQVIRANWAESLMSLFGAAGIVVGLIHATSLSGPLLAALLIAPTLGFAAAPYNSLAAQRAALSPQLNRRRRTEFRRSGAMTQTAIAGGGVALAVGAVALVAVLLVPGGRTVHTPSLVPHSHSPSGGHSTSTHAPSTGTASPSGPAPSSSPRHSPGTATSSGTSSHSSPAAPSQSSSSAAPTQSPTSSAPSSSPAPTSTSNSPSATQS
jgi:cellulose synthase/poly-beta-1,6-N-acetylglucosamine synthase-like glycosyltransferase